MAESFPDPKFFDGAIHKAANWRHPGNTKGFARHNGRCTDPHGAPKRLHVRALRRDACRRLRARGPLPAERQPKGPVRRAPGEIRSLFEELGGIEDFRRGRGRKHRIATVLATYLLARLSNMRGPVAAAECASTLSQREPEAPGAWKDPKTGRFVPVPEPALHRVVTSVDPERFEAALQRFAMARPNLGRAIAVDGKRIRGANRRARAVFPDRCQRLRRHASAQVGNPDIARRF